MILNVKILQGVKKEGYFLYYYRGLYPFMPNKTATFSWRAIASQHLWSCPALPDTCIYMAYYISLAKENSNRENTSK